MALIEYLVSLDQLPDEEVAQLAAETDAHSHPSGVLKNCFGIDNTKKLNDVEKDIVALNLPDLALLKNHCDKAHLQHIHRTLFQGIYPWAGEWRTVTFAKGEDLFLPAHRISSALDRLFQALAEAQFWQSLELSEFHLQAADFFATLNYIHPFREGNGRAQREFLRNLYEKKNLKLVWDAVGDSAMIAAMQAARQGDLQPLTAILRLNSHSIF